MAHKWSGLDKQRKCFVACYMCKSYFRIVSKFAAVTLSGYMFDFLTCSWSS